MNINSYLVGRMENDKNEKEKAHQAEQNTRKTNCIYFLAALEINEKRIRLENQKEEIMKTACVHEHFNIEYDKNDLKKHVLYTYCIIVVYFVE